MSQVFYFFCRKGFVSISCKKSRLQEKLDLEGSVSVLQHSSSSKSLVGGGERLAGESVKEIIININSNINMSVMEINILTKT